MDIKFDFELLGYRIPEKDKDFALALDKIKAFINQRFAVFKHETIKYSDGYAIFYIISDDADEPMKVFGYPEALADRLRQSFGQEEFAWIVSEVVKIISL